MRQPEQYKHPPKILFQDKNGGEANRRREISQKDPTKGRLIGGIREGKSL